VYLKSILIIALILTWILVGCKNNVDIVAVDAIEPTISAPISSPSNANEPVNSVTEQTLLIESHSSSPIAVSPDGNLVVAVNPDSDSITLVDAITLEFITEISVGDNPITVAITPDAKKALVTNYDSATLSVIDLNQHKEIAQYEVGHMPYGVVTNGILGFITEFGIGSVSVIDLLTGELLTRIQVEPFPSGIALSQNAEKLLITHLFTGKITVINVSTNTIIGMASTGLETNLSQFIVIDQDGKKAYIPQTRSNTTNLAPLFDTTVFPIVNVLDLDELQILTKKRITLDTADQPVNMPFSAALSPSTHILYVTNAGSDNVSVIDLRTNRGLANLMVGSNPRGIAIVPDESRIFVNNVLDGTLSVIDTRTLIVSNTIPITKIPLSSTLLTGKKLFNSAASPGLTNDNWISCATCHFDGMMDSRTWLGFPDGPRNTPALFDIAQTMPMHWSGDFDELQDVEITIQKIQFGKGLTGKLAYDSLGDSHVGISEELDALAAYLASLVSPNAPYNSEKDVIALGQSVFDGLNCQTCHMPPFYTDHKLHDVGTGDKNKEKNFHGSSTAFDTPSLRGIWLTAPYFHDGSANNLEEVFQTGLIHNISHEIDNAELQALISFIISLPLNE
jgi:YVTN family beta-propeller protein